MTSTVACVMHGLPCRSLVCDPRVVRSEQASRRAGLGRKLLPQWVVKPRKSKLVAHRAIRFCRRRAHLHPIRPSQGYEPGLVRVERETAAEKSDDLQHKLTS